MPPGNPDLSQPGSPRRGQPPNPLLSEQSPEWAYDGREGDRRQRRRFKERQKEWTRQNEKTTPPLQYPEDDPVRHVPQMQSHSARAQQSENSLPADRSRGEFVLGRHGSDSENPFANPGNARAEGKNPAPQSRNSALFPPRSHARQSDGPERPRSPRTVRTIEIIDNLPGDPTSRAAEQEELRWLFDTIDSRRIDPQMWSATRTERITYNRALIYFTIRVMDLQNLSPSRPSADQNRLQTEAAKSITICQIAIAETPEVLLCQTEQHEFRHYQGLPLWSWLFAFLLRHVGHDHAGVLSGRIQEFFWFVLCLGHESAMASGVRSAMLGYLEQVLLILVHGLHGLDPLTRNDAIRLDIPTPWALANKPGPVTTNTTRGQATAYSIRSISHAARQAQILSAMIASYVSWVGKHGESAGALRSHFVWLLDKVPTIVNALTRHNGNVPFSSLAVIEWLLKVPDCKLLCFDANILHRRSIALAVVCAKVTQYPQLPALIDSTEIGEDARAILSRALVHLAEAASDNAEARRLVVSGFLVARLEGMLQESPIAGHGDVEPAFRLLKSVAATRSTILSHTPPSIQFHNSDLQHRATRLRGPPTWPTKPDEREAKRRRVFREETPTKEQELLDSIRRDILKVFGQTRDEVSYLRDVVLNGFANISEIEQCEVVSLLAHICCAADGGLFVVAALDGDTIYGCRQCEQWDEGQIWDRTRNPGPKSEAQDIFATLLGQDAFRAAKGTRVASMIALRKIVLHTNDASFFYLEHSQSARWCFEALQSSIRDLRTSAGATLCLFVRDPETPGIPPRIVEQNRRHVISLLEALWTATISRSIDLETNKDPEQLRETCLMAWTEAGRFLPDETLMTLLSKLIKFMEDPREVVRGSASTEIGNLARARRSTPISLLKSYWRYLAYPTMVDMTGLPHKTETLSTLLGLSVRDLLFMIRSRALPGLLQGGNTAEVFKIAELCNPPTTPKDMICEPANLGPILAHLLVENIGQPDPMLIVLQRLVKVAPDIQRVGVVNLIQSRSSSVAQELLIIASAEFLDRHAQALDALQLVAKLHFPEEAKSKSGNAVGKFLRQHALGIMAHLADQINDVNVEQTPCLEQIQCLAAVQQLIITAGEYSQIARPQISACLLEALSRPKLQYAALSCWLEMLQSMESDIIALLDTTFFIITHYWAHLSLGSKKKVAEILTFLVEYHQGALESHILQLPLLAGLEGLEAHSSHLEKMRNNSDSRAIFEAFTSRLRHQHSGVVLQALRELSPYLQLNAEHIQQSVLAPAPTSAVAALHRALLDCAAKHCGVQTEISCLVAECLGHIGCIDSNRLESVREQRSFVARHNFSQSGETTNFVLFFLEEVLVKAFLSVTDSRSQGLLSYAMQELLDKCDVRAACAMVKSGMGTGSDVYERWLNLSDATREVLTPFLTSLFAIAPLKGPLEKYPLFKAAKSSYGVWIRSIVSDLLRRPQNVFAEYIFPPLCRIPRVRDLTVTEFLLPYLFVHIIVGEKSTETEKSAIVQELINILEYQPPEHSDSAQQENAKRFYRAIFRVLEYARQWLQGRRSRDLLDTHVKFNETETNRLQEAVDLIPAQLVARRAVDCNEHHRALFYLEQYRQAPEFKNLGSEAHRRLMDLVADIHHKIDEPDCLEGIIGVDLISPNHRLKKMEHAQETLAKLETWTLAGMAEQPEDADLKAELLKCLQRSGKQHELLTFAGGMMASPIEANRAAPLAVQAAWSTGQWDAMQKFITVYQGDKLEDFDVSMARLFDEVRRPHGAPPFEERVQEMREKIAASLDLSATASLSACHELRLRCHALTDLEILASSDRGDGEKHDRAVVLVGQRLEVLGSSARDKQYLLGIHRAAMELWPTKFSIHDRATAWLNSARLARESNVLPLAFLGILRAEQLGDKTAAVENAHLLWVEGHSRKAIRVLQSAIDNNVFGSVTIDSNVSVSSTKATGSPQALLLADAQLTLANWLDEAGQINSPALSARYHEACKTYPNWEKSYYQMGLYYKTLLESEKALDPDVEQSDHCVTFQYHRLIVENYIRSLSCGTKYLKQTLPRALTLWLEMGATLQKAPARKQAVGQELYRRRLEQLKKLHEFLDRRNPRLPAHVFYSALPQIVSRLANADDSVFERLGNIVVRVVRAYPQQALWFLFPLLTTKTESDRRTRGRQIITSLKNVAQKGGEGSHVLKSLLSKGEYLADQMLTACSHGKFPANKAVTASLSRDLKFSHKCTPSSLVVPIEASLASTLPALTSGEQAKSDRLVFTKDAITIESFDDEALVLGSLAKPRRLTARGSDGRKYKLLIKPKDDLRTDQRLMEFNTLINGALIKDAEASRRQLYLRTYAVTPLNEECGIIEWVDGLKTLRDILLPMYQARGLHPDYNRIREMLAKPLTDKNTHIFTRDVLGMFPEVMPIWFIKQFSDPSAWFTARTRYTRSCAVMSMVGTILGLGDRHTENILLEEGNGGVFHVDFNCLFDKGRTFERPEKVPFRLTHNMVAAMGPYGYEGPFRRCAEITLRILREEYEMLMTVLEAFIHDPTLDLQKGGKKRAAAGEHAVVKLHPHDVVAAIKKKIKGYVQDFDTGTSQLQHKPLSIEGQVEELIKAATDPKNLAAMYIGWCPFL